MCPGNTHEDQIETTTGHGHNNGNGKAINILYRSQQWTNSINEEICSLEENKTFGLTIGNKVKAQRGQMSLFTHCDIYESGTVSKDAKLKRIRNKRFAAIGYSQERKTIYSLLVCIYIFVLN